MAEELTLTEMQNLKLNLVAMIKELQREVDDLDNEIEHLVQRLA